MSTLVATRMTFFPMFGAAAFCISAAAMGTSMSFSAQDTDYVHMARIETISGARTSLWVPAIDRLLLAVRASGSEPAAIWVYRPTS